MLGYRHAFHAGNHGDVLKHGILARVLEYLVTKDRPLLYLDSHAGAGRYRLDSRDLANSEAASGIGQLWRDSRPPALFRTYLGAVRAANPGGRLIRYPGSPVLARMALRDEDRGLLYELHPSDFPRLLQEIAGDARFRAWNQDGLAGLKAHLPPRERRALVLLDPSYELESDYRELPGVLADALRRFPTGHYLIWYPLLGSGQARAERMLKAIERLQPPKTLRVELRLGGPSLAPGLVGSGMLLVNPPWVLEGELKQALPWLTERLGGGQGGWRLEWLTKESALPNKLARP